MAARSYCRGRRSRTRTATSRPRPEAWSTCRALSSTAARSRRPRRYDETVGNATLNGVTLNGNYLGDVGTNTFVSGTITQTGNLNSMQARLQQNSTSMVRRRSRAASSRWPTTGRAAAPSISSSRVTSRSPTKRHPWHGIIGNGGLTLVNTATGIINADVSGETLTINPGNVLDAHGQLQNQGVLEAKRRHPAALEPERR